MPCTGPVVVVVVVVAAAAVVVVVAAAVVVVAAAAVVVVVAAAAAVVVVAAAVGVVAAAAAVVVVAAAAAIVAFAMHWARSWVTSSHRLFSRRIPCLYCCNSRDQRWASDSQTKAIRVVLVRVTLFVNPAGGETIQNFMNASRKGGRGSNTAQLYSVRC